MFMYGYAKAYRMNGDGTMSIKVRVPTLHGPYVQTQAQGKTIRNYVEDGSLPWYPSILLPYTPTDGDIVVISTTNDTPNSWLVIGLTGGSYNSGITNIS